MGWWFWSAADRAALASQLKDISLSRRHKEAMLIIAPIHL